MSKKQRETDLWSQLDEDMIEEVVEKRPVLKHLKKLDARNAPSTLKNRRVAIRQFTEFCVREGLTFDDVTKVQVDDWMDELLNQDYAPRSVRTKVYDISALYKDLRSRGVVDKNPVEEVKLKHFTGTKIEEAGDDSRYLEIEEYEKMLEACEKLRNRLLIELLWETGFRATEAVSVQISDIDREERSIEVESAKKGELSSSDNRKVYYSRSFDSTLRKWLDRGGRAKYIGTGAKNEGYLLVTRESDEMAVNRVTEIVRKIAERAGIQEVWYTDASGLDRHRVTAHIFRYSYAVHRTKQGMPLVYLQDLMGHEDMEVTRHYLRYREDDLKQAANDYRPAR